MSKTIQVAHLARIEGHGGITVEVEGDTVRAAAFDVHEGIRLIEALLLGRRHEDVAQIVSRVCAICSVAHTLTSIKATESAFGIEVSPQTGTLRDLMFRGENIESHALHLFCLALPDYLGYPSAMALAADDPGAVKLGLRMKKLGNSIQETIGGRAVHPVNAVPGGFGTLPTADQLIALRADLQQGLEDSEAMVTLLGSARQLDFDHGATSFGALRSPKDYGYYLGDTVAVLTQGKEEAIPVTEYRSLTNEKAVAHSHAKHSSYRGSPFMVGALSRLWANSSKLTDRAARAVERLKLELPSDNPMDNNKAQAVEIVLDVEHALRIVEGLLGAGLTPEPIPRVRPRAATGTAACEAPRGLLVHSYTYDEEGRIAAADIITPTAMNAGSVEMHLRRAVEESPEEETGRLTERLEMIARAYDPCLSCSVH